LQSPLPILHLWVHLISIIRVQDYTEIVTEMLTVPWLFVVLAVLVLMALLIAAGVNGDE
jgi:hypothetical protein